MLTDKSRLLDLLREAGEEPVTLEELEIAGVSDPSLALQALELAGFTVERVIDQTDGRRFECVRLAGAQARGD
ncbi:MAG: hypothetical protein QOD73_2656 [Solirubrobacteraceae bacterium]|jgi:hypothetical protein|nr:hypothetical protein [Solirubrobacteraceae bacterium]